MQDIAAFVGAMLLLGSTIFVASWFVGFVEVAGPSVVHHGVATAQRIFR
jgi:hypothetical protein